MVASLRNAVAGDAGPIAALMTDLGYPTGVDAMSGRLAAILADPDYVTLVADAGSGVVGVAGAALGRYYEKDGVYVQLVALAVAPGMQKQGIGRQLVEAVERWAAAGGARHVIVNSGLHRAGAHAFYDRCGYARTGFRFVRELPA
jgi:GNAT superfamily N-acetyltransferase